MRTSGFRAWCAERGRARFVVTVALMVAFTLAGGALLLVPNVALPRITAAQPGTTASPVDLADPRLEPVRRTMEPFGPLVAERFDAGAGQEAVVVGHEPARADMTVLGMELASSAEAISAVWGADWSRAPLLVIAANPSEFAGLTRSTALHPEQVAAVTVTDPAPPGVAPVQRIVFGPEAGARLSDAGLRTLLRHELTHVATRAATVDGAAVWLTEGFAEYVAHHVGPVRFADVAPTVAARTKQGVLPADLPPADAFAGADAAEAYEYAWALCAYLADRHGPPALLALYHRLAAVPADPAGEDAAFAEILRVTRADLVADWQRWLTARSDAHS
ncbi:hypothetical protein ACWEKT_14850 [Nocardia takedensis]